MNQIIAATILQIIKLGTDLWRTHANKPADWEPSEKDWDELLTLSEKTAAQYKQEAQPDWKPRV